MSEIPVSPLVMTFLVVCNYSNAAIFALLVYDWLLCLDQEVRLIWTWRSRRVTLVSLVYALSRYAWLVELVMSVVIINPVSDQRFYLSIDPAIYSAYVDIRHNSCQAAVWIQIVAEILGLLSFSIFSALRAYALSSRSIWLSAVIVLLALPPVVMRIVGWRYQTPGNYASPYNCNVISAIPPPIFLCGAHVISCSSRFSGTYFDHPPVTLMIRVSQLIAELLVVGITWRYTYQSYRIRRGMDLGKTISSLLFYNGSVYFLFLATLFVLDTILSLAPVPTNVQFADSYLEEFIDPITSIITCRFMLSLREFDSTIADPTYSRLPGPQVREHMASTVLQFAAQPSDSLPAFIASFSHPVHVDGSLFEIESDTTDAGDAVPESFP